MRLNNCVESTYFLVLRICLALIRLIICDRLIELSHFLFQIVDFLNKNSLLLIQDIDFNLALVVLIFILTYFLLAFKSIFTPFNELTHCLLLVPIIFLQLFRSFQLVECVKFNFTFHLDTLFP
jgi:hypothetical protein